MMKIWRDDCSMESVATKLMDVRETASFLRLKESTIRSWTLKRRLPFVKLGGRVFFRIADLEKLVSDSIVAARPST